MILAIISETKVVLSLRVAPIGDEGLCGKQVEEHQYEEITYIRGTQLTAPE